MITRRLLILLFGLTLFKTVLTKEVNAKGNEKMTENEVIVIVAPSVNENYYAPVFDQIIAYDILFVNTVRQHTNVVLVVDSATISYVRGKVPDANLIEASVNDIWVRDFGPAFPNNPVKFRYRPQYLSNGDAAWIENSFNNWTAGMGLNIPTSNIKLDGGNFVHNGLDKAIITTRVFDDNPNQTEAQVDQTIRTLTGITQIAYIPEEALDTTGHSDGMVMFIDANTLLVNENDEPFRTQVLTPIQTAFPNIEIIEVPVDYTYAEWQGFVSACGLHVNSLVTDTHIYMPTYGQTNDAVVQGMIEAETDKIVVPIDATGVCFMGGAVRCLTWYAKGEEADGILAAAASPLAAPTNVIGVQNGTDVELSWSGVPTGSTYEVWRSDAPYFVAHGAGATLLDSVAGTNYVDVGGADGTIYFYAIVVVDNLGRRSVESDNAGIFHFSITGEA
jgi:agmatine/peptidylarginine deiminase